MNIQNITNNGGLVHMAVGAVVGAGVGCLANKFVVDYFCDKGYYSKETATYLKTLIPVAGLMLGMAAGFASIPKQAPHLSWNVTVKPSASGEKLSWDVTVKPTDPKLPSSVSMKPNLGIAEATSNTIDPKLSSVSMKPNLGIAEATSNTIIKTDVFKKNTLDGLAICNRITPPNSRNRCIERVARNLSFQNSISELEEVLKMLTPDSQTSILETMAYHKTM